jgi:hypothetical protein
VFVVDRNTAAVQVVPVAGMAGGVLMSIADFGDRYVVAVDEPFFARNIELQSLAFDGLSPPFTIALLLAAGSFGGLERDLTGDLVFGASFLGSGGTVHRVAHAPNATSSPVAGSPSTIGLAEVNPGSGVLSSFTFAGSTGGSLSRTDTVLGGTLPWAASVVSDPVAISVRDNAAAFGLVPPGIPQATLGSQGNVPALGNGAFALRATAPAGQAALGILVAGFGRGNVATPFGTLLIDPAVLQTIGVVVIPAGGTGTFPLPIPPSQNLAGVRIVFQDAVLLPASAVLSNGLDLTLQ